MGPSNGQPYAPGIVRTGSDVGGGAEVTVCDCEEEEEEEGMPGVMLIMKADIFGLRFLGL